MYELPGTQRAILPLTRRGGGYVFAPGREMKPDRQGRETLVLRGSLIILTGPWLILAIPLAVYLAGGRSEGVSRSLLFWLAGAPLVTLAWLAHEQITRRRLVLDDGSLTVTRGLWPFRRHERRPLRDYRGLALLPLGFVLGRTVIWLVVAWHEDRAARHALAAHVTVEAAHRSWLRLCAATGLPGLVGSPDGGADSPDRAARPPSVVQRGAALREIHKPWGIRIAAPVIRPFEATLLGVVLGFYGLMAWYPFAVLTELRSKTPQGSVEFESFLLVGAGSLALFALLALWPFVSRLIGRRDVLLRDGQVLWRGRHEGRRKVKAVPLASVQSVAVCTVGSAHGVLLLADDDVLWIALPLRREQADWLAERLRRAAAEAAP